MTRTCSYSQRHSAVTSVSQGPKKAKSLDDKHLSNDDKNWIEERERKREFKQTMIYLASKFKLCFVIGVVTI